ncbi:hypothetical protein Q7P37_005607 [Cladosporium fusiforme]
MRSAAALVSLSSFVVVGQAFRFSIWLGDKCTINGVKPTDEEILVFPFASGDNGCMRYQLYDWGHDQSLMIRPEDDDKDDSYLTFFNSADCSGSPLLIFPPASVLRERPVSGCSNYAASGITSMSYRIMK